MGRAGRQGASAAGLRSETKSAEDIGLPEGYFQSLHTDYLEREAIRLRKAGPDHLRDAIRALDAIESDDEDLRDTCQSASQSLQRIVRDYFISDNQLDQIRDFSGSSQMHERAAARILYSEHLQEYAEALDLLEEITAQTREEDLHAALQTIKDLVEPSLSEPLQAATVAAESSGYKPHGRADLLRFLALHDAVQSLESIESSNSAATWSYLASTIGHDRSEEWAREPALVHSPHLAKRLARIATGAAVVDHDPLLRYLAEELSAEESELRIRSAVLGKVPETELVYMPTEKWVRGPRGGDDLGQHFRGEGARPSFTYLLQIANQEQDPDDALEMARKVSVHELLHASQPAGKRQTFASEEAISLEEGITETLAQMRTNDFFRQYPNTNTMPDDASYPEYVRGTLNLMERLEIPFEDRELFLEKLCPLSHSERLEALARMQGKADTDTGASLWQAACEL